MKNVKIYWGLLCVLALLVSCNKDDAPKNYSIEFVSKKVTLVKGQEITLATKVTPDQSSPRLLWKSQDSSIATVTQEGVLKGVRAGNTVVTVQIVGTEARATCLVSVTTKSTGKEPTLTVTPTKALLAIGKQVQLSATMDPLSTEYTVEWYAEHPEIASVDDKGLVMGKMAGETLILARLMGTTVEARCLVEVRQHVNTDLSAEIHHTLEIGYSLTLSVAIEEDESILVDDGSGELRELLVSKNPSNPTLIDIPVQDKTIKLYGAPLTYLSLASNKAVETISISHPDKLKLLNLSDNKLKTLDLSGYTTLESLSIGQNTFEGSLQIALPKLKSLRVDNNKLTALTLQTPALEELCADHLRLTSLTLPSMPHLRMLEVHHNKLSKDAIKDLVKSLPQLPDRNGKCIILNTELPTTEGNDLEKKETLSLANDRGWTLYDGKVEIKPDPIVVEDPQGFDIRDAAYLDWGNASRELITTWEMAHGATYDAKSSDTEDEDYLLLVFRGKAGGDILKRAYTIEEGVFLQVEVFIKPIERVLVTESGAQQRLNKHFVESLTSNGYTAPQDEGANTFYTENANLHSKLLICEEFEEGAQTAKLLFSPQVTTSGMQSKIRPSFFNK